ncbi:hypothetical protein ACSYAD_23700 [Acaryochloris marina NIES-2412]|uniref:hypothetical protein n=1 Tax=Acaryochloris marina TaxID=155978 RepID=UPI0040588235
MNQKLAVLTAILASSVTTAVAAQTAQVSNIQPLEKPGLYMARAVLQYSDGDALQADFRVYCPTAMIRPTNYQLFDHLGHIKKQGSWWETSFQPQYSSERQLVRSVCGG